ncbi:hypothetical protein L1887_25752 [Cichorium endivia]|nr:hypothetical protein L1887_25752 [Cichorium endivia]
MDSTASFSFNALFTTDIVDPLYNSEVKMLKLKEEFQSEGSEQSVDEFKVLSSPVGLGFASITPMVSTSNTTHQPKFLQRLINELHYRDDDEEGTVHKLFGQHQKCLVNRIENRGNQEKGGKREEEAIGRSVFRVQKKKKQKKTQTPKQVSNIDTPKPFSLSLISISSP